MNSTNACRAFDGHGVVDGGAHTADGAMSLETDQVVLLGFLGEGIFQFFAGQAEGDVHQRAGFGLGMSAIEAAALVNGVVDQIRLDAVGLFDGGQTAQFLRPLEDQSHHVDGEGGRRVVQGSAGGEGFVIEHDGQVGGRALEHIVAGDDHGHASRARRSSARPHTGRHIWKRRSGG